MGIKSHSSSRAVVLKRYQEINFSRTYPEKQQGLLTSQYSLKNMFVEAKHSMSLSRKIVEENDNID